MVVQLTPVLMAKASLLVLALQREGGERREGQATSCPSAAALGQERQGEEVLGEKGSQSPACYIYGLEIIFSI